MKNIVFGITNLSIGGAERVLVDIVNKLSENDKYNITILTLYGKGEFEKQISNKVVIKNVYKNSYNEISKFNKILISLRLLLFKRGIYNKYIKDKYDIEIAFLEGPVTRLFSSKNSRAKKIAWVHTDITKIFGNNLKSRIKRIYDKQIYDKYQKIVFVSKASMEQFKNAYPSLNEEKLQVIHNYINKENVIKKANEEAEVNFSKETFNVVTVARLMKEKGIDRLINVHKKLIKEGLNYNIYVVGDGPEKEYLEKIVEEAGIKDTFKMIGKKENPYPYIKNADTFCLFSHYEGYPMTIIEAKLLEKFIIITNTSAAEAVQNYDKSMVVENDEEHIYLGLKELLKNKDKYINIETKTKYDNEDIIEAIQEILN